MEDVTRLVRLFEASEEASQEARDESERARDYYDGDQLTASELAALRKRKQPPVIENLIRPKIDYLCGLERQTRTDPVAYPRTMKDDEAAQVATDVLRYVSDDQKLDIKRSHTFQHMLTEGYGGVEVGAKEQRGVIDPTVEYIAWDRLFYDPHSSQADFSDAGYMGYITWMDLSKAKLRWKDKAEILEATVTRASDTDDSYEDKPRWKWWADKERERLRIVTLYEIVDGVWTRCVYTLAGVLEDQEPSPFVDEDGNPECALIMQSAYIDRENDRYGIVRDLFTLQDEVNKRRSKFLHLVNSRQVRVSRAFEGDAERIRKEIARPDAVIVADADELEIIGTGDMSMGHFNLLAEAKQAIEGSGPNAHMQGKAETSQSGRAILAQQQGGMTEMAPLLDGLRDFNLRVFRAVWNRVRQFWQAERWVRITDDENAVRFAGVNVPKGALAMQKLKQAMEDGKVDQATAQQYAAQIQQDPSMMEPANVISELDVDIQIDEVQNTPTLHAEQFEQLVNMASSGMMQIPPELIIKASNLRNKQELLDIIEEQKQAAKQGGDAQSQMAQQAMQLEMQDKAATIAKKQADVVYTQERAASEQHGRGIDSAKVEIDAFEAGAKVAA